MNGVLRVIEPSGRVYQIYADGHVEGFERPAIDVNKIRP